MRFVLVVVSIFMLFSFAACAQSVMTPQLSSQMGGDPADEVVGYPSYEQSNSSGYPSPGDNPKKETAVDLQITLEAPTPEIGKASISGILFFSQQSVVMANLDLYLTRAIGTEKSEVPPILAGVISEKGDIPLRTNEMGEFSINNVPPGNYYLIVSQDLSVIMKADGTTSAPLLISLTPDQKLPLGIVYYVP